MSSESKKAVLLLPLPSCPTFVMQKNNRKAADSWVKKCNTIKEQMMFGRERKEVRTKI